MLMRTSIVRRSGSNLGGQLEHLSGQGDDFAPAFLAANAGADPFKPVSPARAEASLLIIAMAAQGKVSFRASEAANWIFLGIASLWTIT